MRQPWAANLSQNATARVRHFTLENASTVITPTHRSVPPPERQIPCPIPPPPSHPARTQFAIPQLRGAAHHPTCVRLLSRAARPARPPPFRRPLRRRARLVLGDGGLLTRDGLREREAGCGVRRPAVPQAYTPSSRWRGCPPDGLTAGHRAGIARLTGRVDARTAPPTVSLSVRMSDGTRSGQWECATAYRPVYAASWVRDAYDCRDGHW